MLAVAPRHGAGRSRDASTISTGKSSAATQQGRVILRGETRRRRRRHARHTPDHSILYFKKET